MVQAWHPQLMGEAMTNWGFEEDNDNAQAGNHSELNGPKGLRDAYEKQKQQIDALTQKVTAFVEREEKQQLSKVFESLGIPGAAAVYQGPADPEKAKEWATSMQSVFGTSNQGGTPPVADSTPAEPALPASMQAQFQRMTEAGQSGTPTGNMDAAAASIGDASSPADLIAAFDRLNRM